MADSLRRLNSRRFSIWQKLGSSRALAEGRSLEPFIKQLNAIRRLHPALQQLRTIHFHGVDNDALIAYSKFDPATRSILLRMQPHLREEILQGMRERGPEAYEGFIQDYFKRLTETKKPAKP